MKARGLSRTGLSPPGMLMDLDRIMPDIRMN